MDGLLPRRNDGVAWKTSEIGEGEKG